MPIFLNLEIILLSIKFIFLLASIFPLYPFDLDTKLIPQASSDKRIWIHKVEYNKLQIPFIRFIVPRL